MKKKLKLMSIIAMLFLTLVTIHPNIIQANFLDWLPPEPAQIIIALEAPINGTTYFSNSVPLSFTINTSLGMVTTKSVSYILDGQQTELVQQSKPYSITLKELSDGWHTLTVTATGDSAYDVDPSSYMKMKHKSVSDSQSVTFKVDISPTISILSPKNENYTNADVSLSFILSKPVEHISYSLDEKDNVTINGNITLNGLTSVVHSITVYACDAAGNMGASETVTFTVNADSEPFFESSLFPVIIGVIALGLSVGAVGIFYSKKHKKLVGPTS